MDEFFNNNLELIEKTIKKFYRFKYKMVRDLDLATFEQFVLIQLFKILRKIENPDKEKIVGLVWVYCKWSIMTLTAEKYKRKETDLEDWGWIPSRSKTPPEILINLETNVSEEMEEGLSLMTDLEKEAIERFKSGEKTCDDKQYDNAMTRVKTKLRYYFKIEKKKSHKPIKEMSIEEIREYRRIRYLDRQSSPFYTQYVCVKKADGNDTAC